MRLYRSDAGWQEREKDIRADAVIVSMSPTKLSLGAVASLQSPLPSQPSKIIVPRIVIGGVILDQPAWRRNWRSAWGHLAGTEVTDAPAQGAKKMLLIRHAPACGVPPAKVSRASPLRISPVLPLLLSGVALSDLHAHQLVPMTPATISSTIQPTSTDFSL
jgi:hypothetical protein